jgi:hypothetical protein
MDTNNSYGYMTCEHSNNIDFLLPSLICDPTIVKGPKRFLTIVFFFDLQDSQKKKTYQITYFDHIEAMTRHYILHNCFQSFDLLFDISL